MKKILFIFLALSLILSSCEEEASKGVSKITNYANMTVKGADPLFWEIGTAFVDPGCVAVEAGTDISTNITVESNVNANKVGRYNITYNVLNQDGFPASASRTVYVYKSTDPRNGYYTSKSVRSYNGGAYTTRGPWANSIMVLGNGSDELWIEDLIGGWYYIGSKYGIDYATAGVAKFDTSANPNTMTSLSGVTALPWGYVAVPTTAEPSTYDNTTKTLLLNVGIPSVPMYFRVTMNNPQPL